MLEALMRANGRVVTKSALNPRPTRWKTTGSRTCSNPTSRASASGSEFSAGAGVEIRVVRGVGYRLEPKKCHEAAETADDIA